MKDLDSIYFSARKLNSEDRPDYLARECGDDLQMRSRIEQMLAVSDEAEMFIIDPCDTEIETIAPTHDEDQTVGMTFGRYKVLERIGEGGCGVVYIAEQSEPVRRRVALKVIRPGMDTAQVVARFESERQALAMMDHPNIAKVLDAGSTDDPPPQSASDAGTGSLSCARVEVDDRRRRSGRPYFVMELVHGTHITKYCEEAGLSIEERVDLFIKVCQAIQHAHQKGIVHRDIKPSNILVMLQDGVPVPTVIDFGIAKAIEGRLTDASIDTQLHQFIGTPAYMSPEQAEMSGLDIDTRADIYSLGVLLYELLAGCTPFDSKDLIAAGIDAMRKTIRDREPLRPSTRLATLGGDELTTTARRRCSEVSRLLHQLRGDLDWIVMKCLEKDRTRRYETASGLADDLRRHVENEPVVARPPSVGYKMAKAWRRNRLAFTAGTAVAVSLMVGIVISVWQASVAIEARQREAEINTRLVEQVLATDRARSAENEQRVLAEAALQGMQIQQAEELFAANQPYAALGYLGEVLRANPSNVVAASRLATAVQRPFAVLDLEPIQHPAGVNTVEFSPDGTRVLTANSGDYFVGEEEQEGHAARIWDVASGMPATPPMIHDNRVLSARFSGDGSKVVTASTDGTARVWDAESGLPLTGPLEHDENVNDASFSPDGTMVVTASWDMTARVWDARTGEMVGEPLRHQGIVWSASFSPDGLRVATASHVMEGYRVLEGVARLWDVPTGKPRWTLSHPRLVRLAVFSPDGTRIVTGSDNGDVRLWDSETGAEVGPPMRHDGGIRFLTFSPNGLHLSTASSDKTARVWSVRSGQAIAEPLSHDKPVTHVAFSPDGLRLATASDDATARVWDVATGRPLTEPIPHGGIVNHVRFSPDGRRLATASEDGFARVWNVHVAAPEVMTLTHPAAVHLARFSPDGRHAVTVTEYMDHTVRIWDSLTGRERTPPVRMSEAVSHAEFSPDGTRLVVTSFDGRARLWDPETMRPIGAGIQHEGEVYHASFSPDGRRLATVSQDATARIWDAFTGEPLVGQMDHKLGDIVSIGVSFVQFSPDGRKLLTACDDRLARVWDAVTGELLLSITHKGAVRQARFSPDGRRLVTASADKTARVWDASSGQAITRPLTHRASVVSAEFSPDGLKVLTACDDGRAHIWDAETGEASAEPMLHRDEVTSASFSPDGHRVLTCSADGTVRLWDADTGRPLIEPLQHADTVWNAEFSADGARVITASEDGTARFWEVPAATVPMPDWFLTWAEARLGRSLVADNTSTVISFAQQLHGREVLLGRPEDDYYARIAGWVEGDPGSRYMTPMGAGAFVDYRFRHLERNTIESLYELLSIAPEDVDVWLQLAGLQETRTADPDHLAAAMWSAQMVLRHAPDRVDAWRLLARLQWRENQFVAAHTSVDRALALDPGDSEAWELKGRLMEQSPDLEGALSAFRRAFDLIPESSDGSSQRRGRLLLAQADLLGGLMRLDEERGARTAAHRELGVPARDSDAGRNLVDLSPWYNAGLVGEWHPGVAGNDLSGLPSGTVPFGGMAFDVRGVVQLAGDPNLKGIFPPAKTGLRVGRTFTRLHVVHATGWAEEPGTTVAQLRLRYADGHQHEIPIRYGEEVLDWFAGAGTVGSQSNAKEAWRGANRAGFEVRLFRSTWENPDPSLEISTIDYVSNDTACAPFLIALTVE